MVRKGKSLLFGHISRKFKKRRRYRNYRQKSPFTAKKNFLPFLAEFDISESFETNFFFRKKITLDFAFDTFKFYLKKKK